MRLRWTPSAGVSREPSGTTMGAASPAASGASGSSSSSCLAGPAAGGLPAVAAAAPAPPALGGERPRSEQRAPKPQRRSGGRDSSGSGRFADGPVRQTSPSQSRSARNWAGSKSRKIRPCSSLGSALSQRPLKSSARRERPRQVSVLRVVAKEGSPPTLSLSTSAGCGGFPSLSGTLRRSAASTLSSSASRAKAASSSARRAQSARQASESEAQSWSSSSEVPAMARPARTPLGLAGATPWPGPVA
mmetsp:Transcript_45812/g.132668  ORF Transcript_45812/g.132668 Transcript_45812/m.132668 type:complete len:246 (+) Transcript_45812:2252-2989(+)